MRRITGCAMQYMNYSPDDFALAFAFDFALAAALMATMLSKSSLGKDLAFDSIRFLLRFSLCNSRFISFFSFCNCLRRSSNASSVLACGSPALSSMARAAAVRSAANVNGEDESKQTFAEARCLGSPLHLPFPTRTTTRRTQTRCQDQN